MCYLKGEPSGRMPIVLGTFTYSSKNFLGLSYCLLLLFIDAQEALIGCYTRAIMLIIIKITISSIVIVIVTPIFHYFTCQVIGQFVIGQFVIGQFNKPITFKVVI